MAWLVIGSFVVCGLVAFAKITEKSGNKQDAVECASWLWSHMGKWKYAVFAAVLIAFYICATSFTVVTEDLIICHSPICPTGVSYSYSDVEKITAGVGQKRLTRKEYERKGSFFYQIKLDGKTITFTTGATSNSEIARYEEHTYLWFEEFDQKLVELGIPKESDSTGYENIDMDQEYVDRFLRILGNRRAD